MPSDLILLVDDEPSITQLARMYLERDGYRVQAVGDGESALETVASQRPALIVLDVMLPKLDGFEVCRQLKTFHRFLTLRNHHMCAFQFAHVLMYLFPNSFKENAYLNTFQA